MTTGIRIPALCFGSTYQSLNRAEVTDLGTGKALASLGLVNENLIAVHVLREGLLRKAANKLRSIPVRKRIEMSVAAADIFENGTLLCGDVEQTAAEYTDVLTRTSGLPHTLAKANTGRIAAALRSTEAVMNGLSRGLPLDIYDHGLGAQGGATVRIVPRFDGLGCCMPNNSPGVHVIWLACPAFGIPVLIRPGSAEPFTPYRLIQALIKAGYPPEVFGYYPSDRKAANRIPDLTKGAIVFGSDNTVSQWAGNPLVQIHGSGFSKLIIGEDCIEDWPTLVHQLAENVAANSGRSCFTVSRIIVPRYGKEIAAAIAAELALMIPRPLNDPQASLSAMAMPTRAVAVAESIDAALKKGGAIDMSASHRNGGSRLVVFEGRTYLLPTIVFCGSSSHMLANQEFLFPFAAVVESSNDTAFAELGPTLSLAIYTHDNALKQRARQSGVSLVSVNVPTFQLDRCQPHEENLFELFFSRLSYVE